MSKTTPAPASSVTPGATADTTPTPNVTPTLMSNMTSAPMPLQQMLYGLWLASYICAFFSRMHGMDPLQAVFDIAAEREMPNPTSRDTTEGIEEQPLGQYLQGLREKLKSALQQARATFVRDQDSQAYGARVKAALAGANLDRLDYFTVAQIFMHATGQSPTTTDQMLFAAFVKRYCLEQLKQISLSEEQRAVFENYLRSLAQPGVRPATPPKPPAVVQPLPDDTDRSAVLLTMAILGLAANKGAEPEPDDQLESDSGGTTQSKKQKHGPYLNLTRPPNTGHKARLSSGSGGKRTKPGKYHNKWEGLDQVG